MNMLGHIIVLFLVLIIALVVTHETIIEYKLYSKPIFYVGIVLLIFFYFFLNGCIYPECLG